MDQLTSPMDPLLERNLAFAAAGGHVGVRPISRHPVIIITCVDPRVDPAHVLGVGLGDALVIRNMGGRLTPDMHVQIAILTAMAEQMIGSRPPDVEIAFVHHTKCGAQSLTEATLRHAVTERADTSDAALAAIGAHDPIVSVTADVAQLRATAGLPDWVIVNGYVYDVDTGHVTRH
jgi:carbonic anhydrase